MLSRAQPKPCPSSAAECTGCSQGQGGCATLSQLSPVLSPAADRHKGHKIKPCVKNRTSELRKKLGLVPSALLLLEGNISAGTASVPCKSQSGGLAPRDILPTRKDAKRGKIRAGGGQRTEGEWRHCSHKLSWSYFVMQMFLDITMTDTTK